MNRILILTALALLAASLTFGQEKDKSDKEQNARVEKVLMQMEQEITDSVVKGSSTACERYLTETWTQTNPDGTLSDKASLIAALKSGDLKVESTKNDEMKVRVYGNAAVVTYRSTDKASYKGDDISGQYRWMDVWVRSGERWQIVAAQGTRIAQQ